MYARIVPVLGNAGISRLADITGLDRIGLPVVCAVRPEATTLSVSAGKGLTYEAATVSAAMEAIEVFHAEEVSLPETVGSYKDLSKAGCVVDPALLPVLRHAVLSPATPQSWTRGVDLISGASTAVPVEVVGLRSHAGPMRTFFRTANGLASGAVDVEATLAALLELIERDAIVCSRLAERSGRPLARVSPESMVDLPMVAPVTGRLDAARIGWALYDCAVDTGIPAYFARIWDPEDPRSGVYSGGGAHLDPQVAIVRALTEAAQSRAVYTAGARDDVSSRAFRQFRAHTSPRMQEALAAQPVCIHAGVDSLASCAFETDVAFVCERLAGVGITHIVRVDFTLPPFAEVLAVVRVVAPGLVGPAALHGHPSARASLVAERMRA
jgi:ribosomal protein S12 methylthiotransferase accessory factor